MCSQCGAWRSTCSNRTLWCHHLAALHRKCVLMGLITASLLCVSAWRLCVWLQDGHQDGEDSVEDESMSGVCNVSPRLLLHTVVTWHWQEAPGCVTLSLCFGFNQRWWCLLCVCVCARTPPASAVWAEWWRPLQDNCSHGTGTLSRIGLDLSFYLFWGLVLFAVKVNHPLSAVASPSFSPSLTSCALVSHCTEQKSEVNLLTEWICQLAAMFGSRCLVSCL